MPTLEQLPDDVWLDLTIAYLTEPDAALNFALACKRFHALALPLLYRQVKLQFASPVEEEVTRPDPAPVSARIEHLQRPEVRHHVQEVQLVDWCSRRQPAWRVTYKAAIRLLRALPNLRSVHLADSRVTPELHAVLQSLPTLTAVTMVQCVQSQEPKVSNTQVAPRLEELAYTFGPPKKCLPFFVLLLRASIYTLTSLTISVDDAARVLACIDLDRRVLPLRELVFQASGIPMGVGSNKDICLAVHQLLRSCPGLCTLKFSRYIRIDLSSLGDDALPSLRVLHACSAIVYDLIPGRPVRDLNVYTLYDDFEDPSSPENYADGDSDDDRPIERVEFQLWFFASVALSKQCLTQMQSNVSRLSLRIWHNFHPHPPLEKILNIVFDAISSWPLLRVLLFRFRSSYPPPGRELWNPELRGYMPRPSQDLSVRGHPSLEEVCFDGYLSWLWFPKGGWELHEHDPEGKTADE